MKKFDAFQVKMFMAILMVFDHLPHIYGLIPGPWVGIIHALTRCVSAWFAFMAVEGIIHTRNKLKYNGRLFLWAGIMFCGNSLLDIIFQSKEIHVFNNIFLTLAFGVLMINVMSFEIKGLTEKSTGIQQAVMFVRIVLGLIVMFGGILITEGGHVVLPFMLITYFFKNQNKLRDIGYIALAAVMFFVTLLNVQIYDTVSMTIDMILFNADWLFVTVIPFIYLYNGQRGRNDKFSKYFFYVFYPLHLWIIATISYFVS